MLTKLWKLYFTECDESNSVGRTTDTLSAVLLNIHASGLTFVWITFAHIYLESIILALEGPHCVSGKHFTNVEVC